MEVDQKVKEGDQSFHFLEDDDIVVKVSQAIFDDFHSLVTTGLPFADVIKGLYETCNNGVDSIRKLSAGIRKGDSTLQKILGQLCEERNTYFLLLSLYESELSVKNLQPTTNSMLQNLLISNGEFRKLHTLLKWVESKDLHQPHGFSGALNLENINLDRINSQLCAWNRNQDLEMVLSQSSSLKPQYEESITQLFQLLLAYVRCGRIDDAIELSNQAGCFTLSGLIDTRSALFESSLTPTDIDDENYGFSDTRSSFKHMARKTISKIPGNSQLSQLQQCMWATLSGALSQLLTYATCSDDRLWAHLNCVVEALFDENIVRDSDRKFFNDDDFPQNTAEIFEELFRSEESPVYRIYGYLSTMEYEKIDEVLSEQLSTHAILPAHVVRFYAHLVLLLKLMGKGLSVKTVDSVICQFVDVLISLNQFTLAPYYLSQISEEVRKSKFIQLLRCIGNESIRKEVLVLASERGIDSNEICLAVYQEVKGECIFTGSEHKTTKVINELMRAWRWLTYNGPDTIYDALIEANFIIRKLFVMERMAEAVELIQLSGNSLHTETEKVFADESDNHKPFELERAQREYQGYVDYFEAVDAHNHWLNHIDKPMPNMPIKLSDENWARLDMQRRAEYDLSLQEARERRQRYEQVSTSLRTNAVKLLESILRRCEGWLVAVGGEVVDENAETNDADESDLQKLRELYVFGIVNGLISIYRKSGEHSKVLNLSRVLVDPKYNLHLYLRKSKLRKILKMIAKSGASIVDATV